ncbi:MAG: RecX family transcriptional regulator [Microgenomates group bacterium]|jgi:regulatory protein|nr:RecX family transcriptional regulator [Microgenomates group bacterium]
MSDESAFQHYLNRLQRFLKIRFRTEKEIRDYLKRKKAPEKAIEKIINQLKEEEIINDQQFIKWWVDQRNDFKPKGSFALKQELLLKGIDKELLDNFFAGRDENQEIELALKAIKKKQKTLGFNKKGEHNQKIINFLLRRGFSFEIAKKAFEIFQKKNKI